MKKEELIQLVRDELSRVSNWHDYNNFLCDEMPNLLSYLSVEGLQYLRNQMAEIKEGQLFSD